MSDIARFRTLRICQVILFASSVFVSGCATDMVWADANAKYVCSPRFVRAIQAKNGSGEQLFFEYRTDLCPSQPYSVAQRSYLATIQVDEWGVPPEPFAYHGRAETAGEVDEEVTASQVKRVKDIRFHLVRDQNPTNPKNSIGMPILENAGIMVFWEPTTRRSSHTIILLPYEQPRPHADIAGATTVAILLTPFSVTFDVITFPFQALYAVTHR